MPEEHKENKAKESLVIAGAVFVIIVGSLVVFALCRKSVTEVDDETRSQKDAKKYTVAMQDNSFETDEQSTKDKTPELNVKENVKTV